VASIDAAVTGYAHPLYAASLDEWGEPMELRESGTWILVRSIPGTSLRDAMGMYPLTFCRDWAALRRDIATLPDDLVSLTLVTDPFAAEVVALLRECFDDVRPLKEHYLADLRIPVADRIYRNHRRRSRKALTVNQVEVVDHPIEYLDEWSDLYQNIVQRHGLVGIKAFSRRSFERQLRVPGLVMFRATVDGRTSGIAMCYQVEDVAYGHLMAMSDAGYASGSSYALHWFASEWLEDRCRWLDMGGAAGDGIESDGGLDSYKHGWSTDTATAYLCTLVMDRSAYDGLSARLGGSGQDYFPAYRAGELL
jgi:hypothetical protein